jgi:NAD(P)-dependent dehydrogenase (short-subunit alcohol dehydrogenase family)
MFYRNNSDILTYSERSIPSTMITTEFDHAHAVKPTDGFDTRSLQGKSVVITGAASGIGEACMRSFVSAGAFVTFGDLVEDRAQALVTELGDDKVAFVKCDTRSWEDQASLFKTASEKSPARSVDIVFANAGISGRDSVFNDQSDPATGEPVKPDLNILETNLVGVMYTTRLALHYFSRQQEGPDRDRCLLMTSSIAGYADHNGAPQYSSAKFGVRGMMRSLRQVLPKQKARANIISPWWVINVLVLCSEHVMNRRKLTRTV